MKPVVDVLRRVIDAAHRVTRPVFVDVGNVPASGPFLLVGNHQLLGMQDLPSLIRGLEVERGVHVHGLADRAHFAIPLWRDFLSAAGAVVGTRENCARLLAEGKAVLVYPGGAREVYKRRDQRYQLLWGERTGFARMAIDAGCPIVPFGAVGAEDRFEVVLDLDAPIAAPARALVRRVSGRDDVGTLLVRGTGFAGLPRGDRLYFRFGPPIPTTRWSGRADDPAALGECRDIVRAEVETLIDDLLALRETDPRSALMPRVVDAARTAASA